MAVTPRLRHAFQPGVKGLEELEVPQPGGHLVCKGPLCLKLCRGLTPACQSSGQQTVHHPLQHSRQRALELAATLHGLSHGVEGSRHGALAPAGQSPRHHEAVPALLGHHVRPRGPCRRQQAVLQAANDDPHPMPLDLSLSEVQGPGGEVLVELCVGDAGDGLRHEPRVALGGAHLRQPPVEVAGEGAIAPAGGGACQQLPVATRLGDLSAPFQEGPCQQAVDDPPQADVDEVLLAGGLRTLRTRLPERLYPAEEGGRELFVLPTKE
mmetsp:Transcript_21161/g.58727  ORF Transcript_21161/g.58727 Transcript_21161/m.58727 type:complete len:267 (-) Transcript_21161:3906-4706(-)